jgi:hypothetical protein
MAQSQDNNDQAEPNFKPTTAEEASRISTTYCQNKVVVGWSKHYAETTTDGDGSVYRKCGEYYAGTQQMCPAHIEHYNARYPQGWDNYPGDRCKHGVYVGGVGADYMCWRCEMGED